MRRATDAVGRRVLLPFAAYVADDRLRAFMNMNMLNSDDLRSAIPQSPKRLHLDGVSAQQSRRCRRLEGNVPVPAVRPAESPEDRHSGGMRTGHLDDQRALDRAAPHRRALLDRGPLLSTADTPSSGAMCFRM